MVFQYIAALYAILKVIRPHFHFPVKYDIISRMTTQRSCINTTEEYNWKLHESGTIYLYTLLYCRYRMFTAQVYSAI